jgi:hypothetical protein
MGACRQNQIIPAARQLDLQHAKRKRPGEPGVIGAKS